MGSISNKIIYIIGALLSISYVVIPADDGLLGDGVKDAMGVLNSDMASMITFFIVPAALFVIAFIMVMIRRTVKLGFAFAFIGALLFLYMDLKFAMNHQAYIGCYINAVGSVIAMAGAAMCAFEGNKDEADEEETQILDEKKGAFYGEIEREAESRISTDELLGDELFAESEQHSTDFFDGIEELFMDDELKLEELTNESKESTGNSDITDNGADHDSDNSNDGFWI